MSDRGSSDKSNFQEGKPTRKRHDFPFSLSQKKELFGPIFKSYHHFQFLIKRVPQPFPPFPFIFRVMLTTYFDLKTLQLVLLAILICNESTGLVLWLVAPYHLLPWPVGEEVINYGFCNAKNRGSLNILIVSQDLLHLKGLIFLFQILLSMSQFRSILLHICFQEQYQE